MTGFSVEELMEANEEDCYKRKFSKTTLRDPDEILQNIDPFTPCLNDRRHIESIPLSELEKESKEEACESYEVKELPAYLHDFFSLKSEIIKFLIQLSVKEGEVKGSGISQKHPAFTLADFKNLHVLADQSSWISQYCTELIDRRMGYKQKRVRVCFPKKDFLANYKNIVRCLRMCNEETEINILTKALKNKIKDMDEASAAYLAIKLYALMENKVEGKSAPIVYLAASSGKKCDDLRKITLPIQSSSEYQLHLMDLTEKNYMNIDSSRSTLQTMTSNSQEKGSHTNFDNVYKDENIEIPTISELVDCSGIEKYLKYVLNSWTRRGNGGNFAELPRICPELLSFIPPNLNHFETECSKTNYQYGGSKDTRVPNYIKRRKNLLISVQGNGLPDLIQSRRQKHHGSKQLYRPYRKVKRTRTAFAPDQLLSLEMAFEKNHYLVGRERKELANNLFLTETQVKVWFQNRRTKFKRLTTSEDECMPIEEEYVSEALIKAENAKIAESSYIGYDFFIGNGPTLSTSLVLLPSKIHFTEPLRRDGIKNIAEKVSSVYPSKLRRCNFQACDVYEAENPIKSMYDLPYNSSLQSGRFTNNVTKDLLEPERSSYKQISTEYKTQGLEFLFRFNSNPSLILNKLA